MSDPRDAVFQELAVVGKAFGSAKRLELVDLLAQGERTVDSLARAAEMGLSTVSAHLQVLKLSNLVQTRREGTRIYYRLAGDDVAALYDAMLTVARTRSADVGRALDAYLNLSDGDEVGIITRAELADLMTRGEPLVLDVRPREEYAAGHIPGARNLPFGELATAVDELRQERSIVAYCRGAYCVLAHDAVRLLSGEGVEALRLEDGMLEWRTHGHPVEVGA
ncbi:ArsR/SmtB family transcription factor [Nocardioides massiliensis]|uniref:Rhodanese-related sulfurtransferase/DNA-binding transcriptional ArsR family regulator n=1 Tax=Nocardioides massiliensis TaxID=1325935 RepID=A0ABT9NUC1_9ACTN|nr:metalloregulator ArsR/SmtB family transcription factor [Nocardioides massiliensis]MDP9824023.1 rhodanese-related sulfurtransferase/DNA-binding transcriptional ArsR family regulator [Nocardioides massiliensis]